MDSIHNWVGKCSGRPTVDFFDRYEDSVESDQEFAKDMDALCQSCQHQSKCLAFAVTNKEWGVWGGVYFEDGRMSKHFNSHKTPEDWGNLWLNATHKIDT